MGRWAKVSALAGGLALFCAASAQNVTDPDKGGPSRLLKRIEGAADDLGIKGFPRLTDDEPGTVVELYFSYDNWDVVFITANSVSKDAMLEDAKRFAAAFDMPLADYFVFKGTKYLRIDVEFNDYLPTNKGKRSVEFDLARLSKHVSLMKSLPQPVWFVVEADNADKTLLRLPGAPEKEIDDVGFFELGAPGTSGVIIQSAEIPWFAVPVLLALGSIFVLVPLSIARGLLRNKPPEPTPEEELKSPEEVQAEYERTRKAGWLTFIPLLAGFPLFFIFLSNTNGVLHKAFRAIPPGWSAYLSLIVFLPLALPALALLIKAIRDKRNPQPPPELTPEARQMKFLGKLLLIPMSGVILMLLLRQFVPNWATLLPPWLARSLAVVLPLGILLTMLIGFYRLKRQSQMPLPAESPYRQFAINAGVRIGTKIRDVFQIEADHVNAMATLGGKIGLTTGLLTKMEPEEIKAVIAHEIGHQRAKHVRTLFIFTMCILIPLMAIHFYLITKNPKMHPLMRSPFLIYPLAMILPHVILGARRRKAEFEADSFAVEMMGDPELVIRTLHKLAHLNQTPTKLIGVDEKLSSHPSIIDRERAIRETFGAKVDTR